MSRRSSGRQRVEMAKMKKESNLQVTFSKRRAGLFKKASELCTLTGAEVAILVFSPGKKAFSFGHPGVAPIIDRFLFEGNNNAPEASDPMQQFLEAYRNDNVRDLNMRLSQVLQDLEIEKKKGEELTRMRQLSNSHGRNWWESPVEELTWPQLEQLKASLEDLRKDVSIQKENLNILQASFHHPPPLLPLPPAAAAAHYASTSANINGCFSQPPSLSFPNQDRNFGVGTSAANVNDARFPTGYYMG